MYKLNTLEFLFSKQSLNNEMIHLYTCNDKSNYISLSSTLAQSTTCFILLFCVCVQDKHILSHNNPCFQSNTAITNFLVLLTCEIRFRDVIDRAERTCLHQDVILHKKSET